MAKKPQGQGGSQDDGWLVIAIPVITGILAWFLWEYERAPFIRILYASDLVQYWILKHLYDIGIPVTWGPKGEQMLRYVIACFDGRVNPGTVSFEELYNTQTDVGYRIGFLFVIPCLCMTLWIAMKMRGGELKRTFTLSGTGRREKWFWGKMTAGPFSAIPNTLTLFLDIKFIRLGSWISSLIGFRKKKIWTNIGLSFMKYQAIEWKTAITGAEFDPNVDNPNMEQSKTPTEWLRDNKINVSDGLVDERDATKAFEKQLGGPWEGYDNAPDYIKALLIISWLTLHFFSHSKIVTKVRGDFAVAFTRNERIKVRQIIQECERKYPNIKKSVNGICSEHHFMNTAVLGYVSWSGPFDYWYGGQGSINAPAMWLWLKQCDRTLWYVLQCYGRRVCFIEGAGAVSHFFYEKGIGQDEGTPQIDNAIKGLKQYIDYHRITDLDSFFNKSKLRRDYVGEDDLFIDSESGESISLLERRKRMNDNEERKNHEKKKQSDKEFIQKKIEYLQKTGEGSTDEERFQIAQAELNKEKRKQSISMEKKEPNNINSNVNLNPQNKNKVRR